MNALLDNVPGTNLCDADYIAHMEGDRHPESTEAYYVRCFEKTDTAAAQVLANVKFNTGRSIAAQVMNRIQGLHSPVIGTSWQIDMAVYSNAAY